MPRSHFFPVFTLLTLLLLLLWNLTRNATFIGKVLSQRPSALTSDPGNSSSDFLVMASFICSALRGNTGMDLEYTGVRSTKRRWGTKLCRVSFLSWRGRAPAASLEGGLHDPALDGLRGAPVPHQGHRGLVLRAGVQSAQLGYLQAGRGDVTPRPPERTLSVGQREMAGFLDEPTTKPVSGVQSRVIGCQVQSKNNLFLVKNKNKKKQKTTHTHNHLFLPFVEDHYPLWLKPFHLEFWNNYLNLMNYI